MGECPKDIDAELVTPDISGKRLYSQSLETFHCSFGTQAGMLSHLMYKEHGVDLKELEHLKTIYLVCIGKEEVVSRICDEQQKLLE